MLAQATGNRVLLMSREPVSSLFYPSLDRLFEHSKTRNLSPRRIPEAHSAIDAALAGRDLAAPRDWMAQYMADFRLVYEHAELPLYVPVSRPL